MSYHPLRDFVLVSRENAEEKTASGLLFRPATAEDKIVKGTVIAVGSGRVTSDGTVVPMEVKVGDQVLFNKNFGTELANGGEAAFLLKEEQLLCVVR